VGKPYLPIIKQLKSLSDSGVKLYFIQGNRDFLISETFVKRIGASLLADECVVDLYGTKVLIMHGDTLCTDDKAYQLMRKLFRLKHDFVIDNHQKKRIVLGDWGDKWSYLECASKQHFELNF